MNKKGQTGPFGAIILFIFFLIIWFVWLAGWINQVGASIVTDGGMTGLEAFFFMNLNLVIFIALIIAMFAGAYFATRGA